MTANKSCTSKQDTVLSKALITTHWVGSKQTWNSEFSLWRN